MTPPPAQAVTGGSKIFGVTVSTFQSGLSINATTHKITGTLTKTDAFANPWGEGYFMALKFTAADLENTDVFVGMEPTAGSGPAQLDSDKDGLFKVTDKAAQKLVVRVVSKDGTFSARQEYDLSGLTLSE